MTKKIISIKTTNNNYKNKEFKIDNQKMMDAFLMVIINIGLYWAFSQ